MNQTLSDLDSQLGQEYLARRASLSPDGAELLQRSQKSWLRFITVVCPLAPAPNEKLDPPPVDCLQHEYRSRLKQLAEVGRLHGPFAFNRIDQFSAKPSPDASDRFGNRAGFVTKHVGYPQIDNIDSPTTRVLNKMFARSPSAAATSDCERGGDADVDYRINHASDKLISVTWTDSIYCHGTPHGFGGSKTENIVLLPTPHKLKLADLFGTGTGWVHKLQALFWDGLKKQGWSAPPDDAASIKKGILEIVVNPKRWQFTEKGIEVSFQAYEGGCYACSPAPVTVSWDSLKPLLVQDAPLP